MQCIIPDGILGQGKPYSGSNGIISILIFYFDNYQIIISDIYPIIMLWCYKILPVLGENTY